MDDIIFQISLRSSYVVLLKISLVSKTTRKNISHNIFWYEKYKYDFSDKISNYCIRFATNNFINSIHQYKHIFESLYIANKILYVNNIEKNRKLLKTSGSILSHISSHELLRNILPEEFYNKTRDVKFSIDYDTDVNEESVDYYTLIIDSTEFNQYKLSFENKERDFIKNKNCVTTVDINVIRDILIVLIFHEFPVFDELFRDFYSLEYNIEEIGTCVISDRCYGCDCSDKSVIISIMRLGIYETIDNEKIKLC